MIEQEKFNFLVAVYTTHPCDGCVFNDSEYNFCNFIKCMSLERNDDRDVIFVLKPIW